MSAVDKVHFESTGTSSGASISEAIGGIVAIVLAILGLAHIAPIFLVAIATIAVGVALAFEGAAVAGEYARLLTRPGEEGAAVSDLGGGAAWATEFLAGSAGIILGVLALLNVESTNLVAIAAIGFGGALVLSSNSAAQLNVLKVARAQLEEPARHLLGGVLSGSAGVQAIAGLQAIVLGILALAGFAPVVLILIALLALGTFILVNGSALSGVMLSVMGR